MHGSIPANGRSRARRENGSRRAPGRERGAEKTATGEDQPTSIVTFSSISVSVVRPDCEPHASSAASVS